MTKVLRKLGAAVLSPAAFFLFLIAPKRPDEAARARFTSWYYAHRGLHDNRSDAPENSLLAFKRAADAGYGMEMDVQLTKDLVPVIFHDFTLERACHAPGKISDYTYEELQRFTLFESEERIPKLQEVLRVVGGRTPLIVELKIEGLDCAICPIVDRMLSRYKGMYCIESFNPLGLLWYRIHRGGVLRGQLSDGFWQEKKEYRGPGYLCLQFLLVNFIGRPHFIAYHSKYADNFSRRLCRRMGALGVAWTIFSPAELERARRDFDMFIFEGFLP